MKIVVFLAFFLASTAWALDYPEFKSGVKHETLLQYLAKTVQMSDILKAGGKADVTDMRNRVDAIYSEYLLRFAPRIEERVIENLKMISKNHPESYVRDEAQIALKIIQKKRGISSYDEAVTNESTHTNAATERMVKDIWKSLMK